MNRFLMLFLLVSVILSWITISLEGIPVQKSHEHQKSQKGD